MHGKVLTQLVKALPHRFAGARHAADLEALSRLPDGTLHIDVLSGTATHSAVPSTDNPLELIIARELQSWLAAESERKGLDAKSLVEAGLTVAIDTAKVKTDRKRIVHFDFDIACRLKTVDGTFEAAQREEHVWHDRSAGPA